MLLGLLPPPLRAQSASVTLNPDYLTAEVGDEIEVDVVINDVTNLFGIQLRLRFDPVILQVMDGNPNRSGLQVASGDFPYPDYVAQNEVDNLNGWVAYACTQLTREPVSGSGTTFTVRFECMHAGTTQLLLQDVVAANQDSLVLDTEIGSGEIVVAAPESTPAQTIPAQPTTRAATRTPTRTNTPGAAQASTRTPRPTQTSAAKLVTPTSDAAYPHTSAQPTSAPTADEGDYPPPEGDATTVPATGRPRRTQTASNASFFSPTRQARTPVTGASPAARAVPGETATEAGSEGQGAPTSTDTALAKEPILGATVAATTAMTVVTALEPTLLGQTATPTQDAVAALLSQPTGQAQRSAQRNDRPFVSPDLFICFSVFLVLFTALLIIYLKQRGKGRPRSVAS